MYKITDRGAICRQEDGIIIPIDAGNRDYQTYRAWVAAGNVATPAPVSTPIERTLTLNQWCSVLDSLGKLSNWLALINDTSVKAKDRAYLLTGGDGHLYSENNGKLARLCAKSNIDIKAIFDQVVAS